MTSKDALDKLYFQCCMSNDINDKWFEELKIIEKDLEILEILKKHIYYSAKSHCIRMGDIYKKKTSFDYEDIMEWLLKWIIKN